MMNNPMVPAYKAVVPGQIRSESWLPDGGPNEFTLENHDYRAVISQIKRDIMIEITNQGRPDRWSTASPGYFADADPIGFNNLSNKELEALLIYALTEARQRGLAAPPYRERQSRLPPMGIGQALLAALLLPSVRQKMEQILFQTAVDGIDLVRQAGSLLEKTTIDIQTMFAGGLE